MTPSTGQRVVLLGAGHAHLHVLRNAARVMRGGCSLTVVAPELFWYSGMATGMLGGQYGPEQDQIDVVALVRQGGARLVCDRVTGLDPAARLVRLAGRPPLPYDVLSVALGSDAAPLPGGAGAALFAAKPIHRLWELRQRLEAKLDGPAPRILVVGGGLSGCELAANVAALARRLNRTVSVTLLTTPGGLLRQVPAPIARTVLRALRRGGVTVRQDGPVLATDAQAAHIPGGGVVPFDILVNATGLRPAPVLRHFGLPLDAEGGLIVDRHLRSVADPAVHGAGDCIAFEGKALPRAGVFAVRQGPVLLANILAALDGAAPQAFRPQRRYLWIMNLGDGIGLATYGRWHWHGRAAFQVKDWIDRRFMQRHRHVTPQLASAAAASAAAR